MKITKIETFLVRPRWLFLKMHTDEGIVGLGEPILEGRALTCQTAVRELEPWLIGEDPTRIVHHWQAMYKHAFYRGGPILVQPAPESIPRVLLRGARFASSLRLSSYRNLASL